MAFASTIDSIEELRRRYPPPHEMVLRKQVARIDDGAREFIARTTLVIMATSGRDGGDASPRGGPPGFVRVLDGTRLAFGDLSGNRRLDSLENLLVNPQIGMLFLVPGVGETLRVNGRAVLTTDPEVLAACALDDVTPNVAVGIDVEALYIHCPKAFRRSGLWQPETWPETKEQPRAAAILKDHLQLDESADEIEASLEAGYEATVWKAGGKT